jgi:hypothetical protein
VARTAPDRPTVGLTFFLREKESVWNNGAWQNCVFLWQLLRASSGVGRVFAINGGDAPEPAAGLMLKGLGIDFVRIEDVVDELDVLIEGAAQVSAENVERVRARGGKAVGYKFGNAFVIDAERIIHGKEAGAIFNGARFDEIWTTPQHVRTCASYWETCYRCPVRVLPHIWEPLFVDAAVKEFPEGLKFGYQPGRAAKRIAIFEPNINIVKTCIIPMLACEQAFRRCPDAVGDIYVTNAIQLKEHLTFKHFANALDIVKAGRCSFESRYNTPWFMAKYGDVMVSSQWENAMNYAYYDALYGGYPLVHNSEMLPKGVGYYYEGFDAADGGSALLSALITHDARAEEYQKTASAFLETVRTTAPTNIEAHERALNALYN